jgi:NitT/TauT family transport system permease protein
MSLRGKLPALAALVGLILAWQILASLASISTLPGPGTVAVVFVSEFSKGLGWHLAISTYRVVISSIIAVVLAAPIGLALGQNRRLDRLAAPLIYVTYPIPKIVLLPVVLVFLGLGDVSKIFMISLILFFQVLVVVRDASTGVRPELISSVRSLGAGMGDLMRYVYLPACLPAILTSLRVTTGTAIAVLFFVESFATNAGLGYYIIVEGWGRLAYPQMYAGVVAMSILGVVLYAVLDVVEKRACRWTTADVQA